MAQNALPKVRENYNRKELEKTIIAKIQGAEKHDKKRRRYFIMAKIDTTKIEGYETMSAEEKLAALEGLDIPEPDYSGWVQKDVFDKTASDLAKAKKDRNGMEKEKGDLEAQVAELVRDKKISTTKDKYIASGFSVELAQATAEAFVDGNMDVVLENITKHATDVATAAKDEALKGTPAPPASGNANPGKIDYGKKAAEAMAVGNVTEAAYYSRMANEQK
jgi:hypothetical protein